MPDAPAATPAAPAAAATAAAPAAPTTPAAPPALGKAAAPATNKPADNMLDAYDALDRMAQADPPDTAPDANKGADNVPDEPDDKGADNANPDDQQQQKPTRARDLRHALDQTKTELNKANARIKELEAKASQPAEDPEKKTLTETLSQRDKRLQELEEELRFTNYERSQDYKDKYERPFLDAYKAGRDKVASMKLTGGDGTARQGTAADFDALMRITDDDAAADFAAETFGNKAATVMYHRERVQEMHRAGTNAVEEFRKNGGEREKQRTEQITKQRQEISKSYETEMRAGVEKYPQWFKPVDGDQQGNELLEKGFALADAAFGKPMKGPDGKPVQLSPQQTVKLHAAIRNKAAGFDRMVYFNKQLKAELKSARKELEEFKASEPGNGAGRGKTRPQLSTWDTVENDLMKRAGR